MSDPLILTDVRGDTERRVGHVTLTRSERSAIAALVTDLLEAAELS